jgi:hypothetical protein
MLIQMTRTDHELSFSDPGPDNLRVWLEPWAEEFEIPALSTIALSPSREDESCPLGELEWAEDHLIIWASAEKVAVSIDGVAQHSGSASIPIPEGLSKAMLGVLFADQPAARLGGTEYIVADRPRWWTRLKHRLGLLN